jgi:hypothetical protein
MVAGPRTALTEVEKLEAADAYQQAFILAANDAERAFLADQIADHSPP